MAAILIDGVRHFYRSEGDRAKPTLVLAHPIGADHGIWDQAVPLLTSRFHVLRYDLRGHGATETTFGPYTVDLLADDIAALTERLGIPRFALCGVSLGGLAGLALAARHYAPLEAMIVANASPKLPLTAEIWNGRIDLVRRSGMAALVDGMIERMFSAAYRTNNQPFLHTMINTFLATDPNGYASGLAALRDADLRTVSQSIRTKTLIIGSRGDMAVPASDIALLKDIIPSASALWLEGGHLSPVESPDKLCEALFHFLA